jgi:hypothetical protein
VSVPGDEYKAVVFVEDGRKVKMVKAAGKSPQVSP